MQNNSPIFHSFCPAKINLFLKLVGKRADGYHELESLFAFLDLADELVVSRQSTVDGVLIEVDGEFGHLLDVKNNLFTKILDYFVAEFGVEKNLRIKITKNIPLGAGLGGGSSDAAYFLRALNKMFVLNLTTNQLQEISLKFGSDIAFLLQNQAAIVRGRGEIIMPFADFSAVSALLINPKIEVATGKIFAAFDENFSAKISDATLLKTDLFDLMKNLPNEMTRPAIICLPLIDEILQQLKNNGAVIAKMSGSGATCFGIFEKESDLNLAQDFFKKKFPQFFVRKVNILDRV